MRPPLAALRALALAVPLAPVAETPALRAVAGTPGRNRDLATVVMREGGCDRRKERESKTVVSAVFGG